MPVVCLPSLELADAPASASAFAHCHDQAISLPNPISRLVVLTTVAAIISLVFLQVFRPWSNWHPSNWHPSNWKQWFQKMRHNWEWKGWCHVILFICLVVSIIVTSVLWAVTNNERDGRILLELCWILSAYAQVRIANQLYSRR